jgi:1,2-phenylacetyl-CoA epoxidase catalytic subunit
MDTYGDPGKRSRSPDGEEHEAPIFWSKKVQHDLKHGKRGAENARQLETERLAELERVRARRHACSTIAMLSALLSTSNCTWVALLTTAMPCLRRAQNEAEWAQRQEDIGDLERMRLAAEAAKEAAKEEEFHLRQNIGRAQRRLDENRAHIIDRLIQAVHLLDSHPIADAGFQPHTVLDGLRVDELQDLLPEVQLFRVR